jgi:hypothetical protein
LLLFHDAGDRVIPVEESARIVQMWPGSERVLTEGLGHTRILLDPEVIARATAFIGSGPSGSVRARTSGSHKRTLERQGSPAQRS